MAATGLILSYILFFVFNVVLLSQQISNRRINELELNGGQPKTKTPRLGDMYVSRHSNLAQVIVLFVNSNKYIYIYI